MDFPQIMNFVKHSNDSLLPSVDKIALQLTVKMLTFVYLSIVSIIINDDQQYATILVYLFIPSQLYVFRATSSPIIRST